MTEIQKLVKQAIDLVVKEALTVSAACRSVLDADAGNTKTTFNYLRKMVGRSVKPVVDSGVDDKKGQGSSKLKKDGPKPFVLSAWNFETGRMMDIREYSDYYNLPFDDVISYNLITHTGTPFFNIRFREAKGGFADIDYDAIKVVLSAELSRTYVPREVPVKTLVDGVLKWADLHFGAHIRNLVKTPDYDSGILADALIQSVNEVNKHGFSAVHVHINGDLIESLSGLNHINSWMSMNKEEIGANAVKLCTKIIDAALSKVNNLGCIKIIGGNHDRLSKDNDEDVKGGVAELIAWGLEMKGYDVEFHPYVITHQVDGIVHINLHGDKGISKKSTEKIIWDYGKQGFFNFIFEAHLHTIIENLSTKEREKFKVVKDDAVDHRRMHLPSFFTGNYYSETLGFSSLSGYVIVSDNGNGKPNVFTGCI